MPFCCARAGQIHPVTQQNLIPERAEELIAANTKEISSDDLCTEPLVSVCVCTYNHARFIRQALDSVFTQETSFPFEVIIGEDRSTDGTAEIVVEYERRFPQQTRLLMSTENLGQYTGNGRLNLIRCLQACRGQYVAFLEGDDYWTATDKLQTLSELFEQDPEINTVFHNIGVECEGKHGPLIPFYTTGECSPPQLPLPRAVTRYSDLVGDNFIHISSLVTRNRPIDREALSVLLTLNYGDWFLPLHFTNGSEIQFVDRTMSCYRFHGNGAYGSLPVKERGRRYGADRRRLQSLFRVDGRDTLAKDASSPRRQSYFVQRLKCLAGSPPVKKRNPRFTFARSTDVDALPIDLRGTDVESIARKVHSYTMTSIDRIAALVDAVNHLEACRIPGAIVECGVWKGGSMMAVAIRLIELQCCDRDLFLFDTFSGMTEPSEADKDFSGTSASARLQKDDPESGRIWARAGLMDVRRNCLSTGYPADRFHLVPGKVEDTIPEMAPEQIALLRLDTDWYESTRHELQHLYDRVAPGGVVIIDDYGYWQGARKAVDEFMSERDLRLYMHRVDDTGRLIVKP